MATSAWDIVTAVSAVAAAAGTAAAAVAAWRAASGSQEAARFTQQAAQDAKEALAHLIRPTVTVSIDPARVVGGAWHGFVVASYVTRDVDGPFGARDIQFEVGLRDGRRLQASCDRFEPQGWSRYDPARREPAGPLQTLEVDIGVLPSDVLGDIPGNWFGARLIEWMAVRFSDERRIQRYEFRLNLAPDDSGQIIEGPIRDP